MTDTELEAWRAQNEAKRAQNAYFRGVRADDWAAPVLAVPKTKRERKTTATSATPRPRVVVNCEGCGAPTRANNTSVERYPGTKPRGRKGLCTSCVWEAKRPAGTRRKTIVTDVPRIITLYTVDLLGAPAIAQQMGLHKSKVLRELHSASITLRDPRSAALVRAA